jgi:hypothetical protein
MTLTRTRQSLLFSFPALCVGVPNAVCEQAIEIGQVWITVDVEAQACAVVLARPLVGPHCGHGLSPWKCARPSACLCRPDNACGSARTMSRYRLR